MERERDRKPGQECDGIRDRNGTISGKRTGQNVERTGRELKVSRNSGIPKKLLKDTSTVHNIMDDN